MEADIGDKPERYYSDVMQARLASVGLMLLFAACDRIYGVESRTTFRRPVNIGCVNEALSAVPNVGRVSYHQDESHSTELLPKHREIRTVIHLWLYGERGASALQINETPDGWEFTNTRRRMGSPVPEEEIARFIPLMRQVNEAVTKRCGLPLDALEPQRL